eukprot:g29637.t1
MVNMRSGPEMYSIRVGAMVLNKHVDHMKAANSRTVKEQNVPGSSTAFLTVLEPVGSPSPTRVKDTTEPQMDTADIPPRCLCHLKRRMNFFGILRVQEMSCCVLHAAHIRGRVGGTWPHIKTLQEGATKIQPNYVPGLRMVDINWEFTLS